MKTFEKVMKIIGIVMTAVLALASTVGILLAVLKKADKRIVKKPGRSKELPETDEYDDGCEPCLMVMDVEDAVINADEMIDEEIETEEVDCTSED